MQQFVVPQFIDVEDKIFGPVTTRQFLILLVASGILFVCYSLFDLALFGVCLVFIGGGALVIAFARVNGQAFHYFLVNVLMTLRRPTLRVWRKDYPTEELNYLRKQHTEIVKEEVTPVKRAQRSHIRDLSLLVNTGGYFRPDDEI